MHWLVKLFFWPWFAASYREWQGQLTNWQVIAIVVCLFVILFALQGPVSNPVGNRVKKVKSGWPSFLRYATTAMAATIEVGIIGYALNLLVVASNGGFMPVAPHTVEHFLRYQNDIAAYHVLANAETNFLILANYISVDSPRLLVVNYISPGLSRLLVILYRGADYVSPGDLLMAASIIATWWIALAIVVWAFVWTPLVWIARRAIQRLTA